MKKPQLINFVAKIMEDSGFNVYKNFKTSQKVIDIYAVLPTTMGDFGVVVACKNYDKDAEVGIGILKEMEEVAESLKASKVTVVTSSFFNDQATNYALRKNIKLVDRTKLLEMAKKYQDNASKTTPDGIGHEKGEDLFVEDEYPEYTYDASDMDYLMQRHDDNPIVYKNTLYPQVDEDRGGFLSKFFANNRNDSRPVRSLEPANLHDYNQYPQNNWFYILQPILSNGIVTIILVVLISYLLSFICGNVLAMNPGFSGLIEMVVALLLSYGLTFIFADRSRFFITRGTFIFFISLVLLIILIFI